MSTIAMPAPSAVVWRIAQDIEPGISFSSCAGVIGLSNESMSSGTRNAAANWVNASSGVRKLSPQSASFS